MRGADRCGGGGKCGGCSLPMLGVYSKQNLVARGPLLVRVRVRLRLRVRRRVRARAKAG